ncbi:teichuronic acid biosynthesis glycosyl transferase [Opitutaceae bacterium TAV5]|nr:teichuronic acid biosynthesis glycosyl transferase [Opitutaceae bacterium TAV5]
MISIVIPNYNKGKFISETLDSLICQDYNDWEAIVVDDCSTDNSHSLIAHYCLTDCRIRNFSTINGPRGGCAARNIGIENAKGTYIMFLDSDDLLTSICLERRVGNIEKSQDDFQVYPAGTFYKTIGDSESVWAPKKGDDHLRMFLRHNLPWTITSGIFRSDLIKRTGRYDEELKRLQDVEFHSRILFGSPCYTVHEHCELDFYYRISSDKATFTSYEMSKMYVDSCVLYLDKMYKKIVELNADDKRGKQLAKALSGTLISIVSRLNIDRQRGGITKDELKYLRDLLLSSNAVLRLKRPILVYIEKILSNYGMAHARGIPRVLKYLFS